MEEKKLRQIGIYIEEELFLESQKYIKKQGRKRSGLLNMLLKEWVDKQKKKEEGINNG